MWVLLFLYLLMKQMALTSMIRILCWAMKKVDTRQMQAAEMRMISMMCGKMRCDGIPNVLLLG